MTTLHGFLDLRVAAEVFHDAQEQRIRLEHRLRGSIDQTAYTSVLGAQTQVEDESNKVLVKVYRRIVDSDVRQWQKDTRGVGEHLLALLLGHVGHPRVAFPHAWVGTGDDRRLVRLKSYPRNVAKLWAYCGHGNPNLGARKRGMTPEEAFALGNPRAKTIVHLLAEAAVKSQPNVHADAYYQAREKYKERKHEAPCIRCGPSGRPAQPGSPWSLAHQHAAALRYAGKSLLRNLWVASEAWPMEVEVEVAAD